MAFWYWALQLSCTKKYFLELCVEFGSWFGSGESSRMGSASSVPLETSAYATLLKQDAKASGAIIMALQNEEAFSKLAKFEGEAIVKSLQKASRCR